MSKLIKVSDVVGAALAKRAAEDNLSMAGEVAKLLSVTELPPSPVDTSYFDKKFEELKALIEDTTVDRLDGGTKVGGAKHLPLCWENCLQEVYFEFEDNDPCWLPGVKEAWGASDFMDTAIFESDGEYVYDITDNKLPVLKVTPELREFLNERGFSV